MIILVMGVSGSGKTTIGSQLAQSLNFEFHDADEFHSSENIEKMRQGIALNDHDRLPWLEALRTAIAHWHDQNVVLACSALKAEYREFLNVDRIIYLNGSPELIRARLHDRKHHYMPESLLDSQFETLEVPKDAMTIEIALSPDEIVKKIRSQLSNQISNPS
jgi:gluconokinase